MDYLTGEPPIYNPAVRQSVTSLYRTFQALHGKSNKCLKRWCNDPTEVIRRESLKSTELSRLSADDVMWWINNFLSRPVCPASLRYLLPRICELCCEDSDLLARDFSTLCFALQSHRWKQWPDTDRFPIEKFFHCLWRQAVCSNSKILGAQMFVVFKGLILCEGDLRQYLDVFASNTSFQVVCNATELILELLSCGNKPRQSPWTHALSQDVEQQIYSSLVSHSMLELLRQQITTGANSKQLDRVHNAIILIAHELDVKL